MTRMKLLSAVAIVAATVAMIQGASAQTVHFLGAGSSAMYTGFAVAAVNDLAPDGLPAGSTIHHYTISGGCQGGTCAQLVDTRAGNIPNEAATLWVVWIANSSNAATDVWAYLQVDSVVGVRSFLSRQLGCGSPCNTSAVKSLIDAGTKTANAGQNKVSPALFQFGAPSNGATQVCTGTFTDHCDDQFLPNDVWTAVSGSLGKGLTAGLTDIRAEDAKYATKRANAPLNTTNLNGLGYSTAGSSFVGKTIKSGVDGGATGATPVTFGLPGATDPITGTGVPSTITTIPIGEAPILFIANRTNANGLGNGIDTGAPQNSVPYYDRVRDYFPLSGVPTVYPLAKLFKGKDCEGNAVAFTDNGTNKLPPGGGTFTITQVFNPGKVAGTVDYKWGTKTSGANLAIGQKISIVGFANAANNGTFTITDLNPAGSVNRIQVAPSGQVSQTTSSGLGLTNNFPIHVFIREPLSGTMNTTEFTSFRIYGSPSGSDNGSIPVPVSSQEGNISIANGVGDNPLNHKPCIISYGPVGDRTRHRNRTRSSPDKGECRLNRLRLLQLWQHRIDVGLRNDYTLFIRLSPA
jgi:hypothetical protein